MDRITKFSAGVAVIPHDRVKEAAERLATYEDTGLTPEEIVDGQMLTGWIPVGERMPNDEEMVFVSCRTKSGRKSVNRAYYLTGSWHGSGSMSGVTAWMPLPEPYKPD